MHESITASDDVVQSGEGDLREPLLPLQFGDDAEAMRRLYCKADLAPLPPPPPLPHHSASSASSATAAASASVIDISEIHGKRVSREMPNQASSLGTCEVRFLLSSLFHVGVSFFFVTHLLYRKLG